MKKSLSITLLWMMVLIYLPGCVYKVPITDEPTRKVDPNLSGKWYSKDGREKLRVTLWDSKNYLVNYGDQQFKVFHSDLDHLPLLSVQELETNNPKHRKFAYLVYQLSNGGKQLKLKLVSLKLIDEKMKDQDDIQDILKAKQNEPDFYQDDMTFYRKQNGSDDND